MNRLPTRIQSICNMAKNTDTVAYDLCCDHGQIGQGLVSSYPNFKKIISCDIVPSIIKKLQKNMPANSTQEVLLADATKLKVAVDSDEKILFIVAGIGGLLAMRIFNHLEIECAGHPHRAYIFNVNNHIEDLRVHLRARDFKLTNEDLILDRGKYYQIFRVETQGKWPITKVGTLMWNPYTGLKHNYLISKLELINKKLCYTSNNEMLDLKGEYLAILNQYHKEAAMYGSR